MEQAPDYLTLLGSSPIAICMAIVISTFILEDATTVTVALLAAAGTISPALGIAALFCGIFFGDLALYGLGTAARSMPWARKRIGEARIATGREWLQRRYVVALLGARFMPGLRLPTYAASGFLRLPFRTFVAVAALAGLIWTSVLFTGVYFGGRMAFAELGNWRWAFSALVLLLVLLAPVIAGRFRSARTDKAPPP
jgi:membrane protein DedA with SNARE-associated domain